MRAVIIEWSILLAVIGLAVIDKSVAGLSSLFLRTIKDR
ncbi:MAG: hypothetical protein OFPII_00280 [Osedax symbiont Rs1]|nr:MAG: hypothetical protein OFPII_00280 [Osedax symbiont Rs1]